MLGNSWYVRQYNDRRKDHAMISTRVQERGQITVPQSIRRQLGIEKGTTLVFTATGDDSFVCRVVPRLATFWEKYGKPDSGPDLDAFDDDVAAAVARDAWTEADQECAT
jgi:AbrB family looped-hinge helix DNA binding protein